jgi:hypothetical protein
MKKPMVVAVSAVLGLALCLLVPWLSDVAGMAPHFPAPGGEDDFSYRAALFLLAVCPAYAALGGWIGHAASRSLRHWLMAWSGAVIGILVVLGAAFLLRGRIEALSESGAANMAVLAFYAAYVLLAGLGALLAYKQLGSAQ